MLAGLSPCPSCGSIEHLTYATNGYSSQIVCTFCGYSGPAVPDMGLIMDAVKVNEAWNKAPRHITSSGSSDRCLTSTC